MPQIIRKKVVHEMSWRNVVSRNCQNYYNVVFRLYKEEDGLNKTGTTYNHIDIIIKPTFCSGKTHRIFEVSHQDPPPPTPPLLLGPEITSSSGPGLRLPTTYLDKCLRQHSLKQCWDPDPQDPHVFRPSGSGSGSISQRYESGSGSGSFPFLK